MGRYVHVGRALLVDNIQITQRTTSAPTPSPTFSPTKSKNTGPTSQPTKKTDAPTTTNVLSCPSVGDNPIFIPSGSVMLQPATNLTLCTLTKVVTSSETGDSFSIPIARSYDGNSWEKAAGEYAASFFVNQGILCYESGCQINLPHLDSGSQFNLASYSYSLSKSDEAARFLETATFGITQSQLDAFENSSNNIQDDIIGWVSNQMNASITPMTSHREFWRKRLTGRVSANLQILQWNHYHTKENYHFLIHVL